MANLLDEEPQRHLGFLTAVINSVADPIFVKDRDHRFVFANEAFYRFMELDPASLLGKSDRDFFPEHEVEVYWRNDEIVLETGKEHISEETLTDLRGRVRSISTKKARYQEPTGELYIVGIIRDVTDRKESEDSLRRLALHDPLTGLANRLAFEQGLAQALARVRTSGRRLALMFIDLDRFKMVNDSLGHAAGDQLLIATAQRLQSHVRKQDLVARLAGDEFACLIEGCEGRMAVHAASRLERALRQPFQIDGVEVRIGGSIGIAYSSGDDSPEDLLRFADVAMYRAKQRPGGKLQIFDAKVDLAATERLHVQGELLRALERQELTIHYQPIVDLQAKRIWGTEALVRWQHPTRGLVPPDEFIPLAEETGVIVPLGEWVLREACRQVACWQEKLRIDPDLTISVNVSAVQLDSPEFVATVREILQETRISPSRLMLEITESTALQSAARARELRDMGVRLAIDDFGTGYASLSCLRDVPADVLKIARGFTRRLGDRVETSLVRAILSLARDLKLVSIAEGIESRRQSAVLRTMRCPLGQGYLFAHPMPGESFGEHLLNNSVLARFPRAAEPPQTEISALRLRAR
ncbi:MAG TPA: EAL domain-containing protein [Thermoanaerobaculia bacterium]|nr:EAL domain-containing protein [Thermoanaerobaculia bacterium]